MATVKQVRDNGVCVCGGGEAVISIAVKNSMVLRMEAPESDNVALYLTCTFTSPGF